MSPEDHRQLFLAFVAALIADFDRYLDSGDIDFVRDRVGYRMVGLWLSDEELAEFARDLNKVVRPRLANVPEPGRVLRVLRTIVLPATEPRGDREHADREHGPTPT